MSRDTCLKRILKIATTCTAKPTLVTPDNGCKPNTATQALIDKCRIEPQHTAKEKSDSIDTRYITGDDLDLLRFAVEKLLDWGTSTDRNNAAWLRSVECRKARLHKNKAIEVILEWNKLNTPSLPENEVITTVESAYREIAYDPGTKQFPELKKARALARERLTKKKRLNRGTDETTQDDKTKSRQEKAQSANKRKTEKKEEPETDDVDTNHFRLPVSMYDIVHDKSIKERPEPVGRWISFRKKTTLLGAREKTGKSTFAIYDAKYALEQGHKVLFVGGWGDTDKDELKAMYFEHGFDKLSAKANKNLFHISTNEELPQSWEELFYQIRTIKPDLLILDTLTSVLNSCHPEGAPDTSEAEKWSKIVTIVKPLAVELNMAVVWIHHTTKANMEEFRGSTAIAASVDYCVLITYRKKFSNERRILAQGRVTMAIPHEMYLTFVSGEKGFVEYDPKKVAHTGTVTGNIESAVTEILSDGNKVDKQDIEQLLKDKYNIEFSVTTLRRVRRSLNIEVERVGNEYYWSIPENFDEKS